MAYTRITAVWTGATGLPGYSRFHFNGDLTSSDASTAANAVRNFFTTVRPWLPSAITIQVGNVAEHFDLTGALIGTVSYAALSPETGSGTAGFSAASGACVTWLTDSFLAGRSVKGRTFLVPLDAVAYQTDGTLVDTTKAAILNAGYALASTTPPLVIVSRAAGLVVGISAVTDVRVADKAAVLRSRRD